MTELSVLDDLLLCSYTKCNVKIEKTGLEVEPTNKISKKKCWTDKKVFANYDDLKNYLDKTNKFQCDQCGEGFWEERALADHKEDVHREFKCEELGCDFKAKKEADLRHHMNHHYLESGQLWRIKRYIL